MVTVSHQHCGILFLIIFSAQQIYQETSAHLSSEVFYLPDINFNLWLVGSDANNNASCLPIINRSRAASDIMNFTRNFLTFRKADVDNFNIDNAKMFSFALNKGSHFLNKFPGFLKEILPNISTYQDILILENALDMFSILQEQRHILLKKLYFHMELSFQYHRNGSFLLAFKRHVKKEKEKILDFFRFVYGSRSENIHFPSRYQEGTLPGLDEAMKLLNLSTEAKMFEDDVYYLVEPHENRSLCLNVEHNNKRSSYFLKVQTHINGKSCLKFRVQKEESLYFYSMVTTDSKQAKIEIHPECTDAVTAVNAAKVDLGLGWRLMKLPQDTALIIWRMKLQNAFLKVPQNTTEVFVTFMNCCSRLVGMEWHLHSV